MRISCVSASFNGAATLPPRKPGDELAAVHVLAGFNGAATLPPRKHSRRPATAEAADPLQRSRDVAAAETSLAAHSGSPRACFNGAATLPPRKLHPNCRCVLIPEELQRSRDVAAAETGFGVGRAVRPPAASTEPRRCRRGNQGVPPRPFLLIDASTEPRRCRRGNEDLNVGLRGRAEASTEPRRCRRGNRA